MAARTSSLPVVGIAAHQVLVDESGFTLLHFAAAVPYVKAVRRSGAIPVVLPVIDPDDRAELDSLLDAVDAVIVTGGCDVEPSRYGAEAEPETGPLDPRRDATEIALCRALVERDQPTLCVCRGIQVLNVALGGTLVQHVPEHSRDDAYNDTVHEVTLDPDSRIAAALGRTTLGVNTLHHQTLERLGDRARAVGWAGDGTVEAIEVEGAPHVLAVQWHPEMLRHRAEHLALFRQLFELRVSVDDETRLTLGATFDAVADGYDARPPYPDAIYTLLADRCGCGLGSRVLEIGPATGLATMRLLDLGAKVTAVEPGPALARRLQERAAGRPLEVVVGSFETAELPATHFDLVAAATSFHWVDPNIGLAKVAGHLRRDGWLALWWTSFGDPDRPDPFQTAIEPMLEALAAELLAVHISTVRPYALDTAARIAEIDATGLFGPVEHHVVAWEGHHSAVGIRRLFATFSPWLALPEDRRNEILDALERIARDEFNDSVTRPYVTPLFLAQRRSA